MSEAFCFRPVQRSNGFSWILFLELYAQQYTRFSSATLTLCIQITQTNISKCTKSLSVCVSIHFLPLTKIPCNDKQFWKTAFVFFFFLKILFYDCKMCLFWLNKAMTLGNNPQMHVILWKKLKNYVLKDALKLCSLSLFEKFMGSTFIIIACWVMMCKRNPSNKCLDFSELFKMF